MANDPNALTSMWMMNPWMFDPTQKSNQFSSYNNAAMPYPGTYNEGLQGGPVNAATGKPIQSYLDWKAANPAGVTLNNTPAQPQPQQQPQQQQVYDTNGVPLTGQAAAWAMFDPSSNISFGAPGSDPSTWTRDPMHQWTGTVGGPTGTPAATPQASGPPNNWQAALNSLANPGNPVTQGANVPIVNAGGQPSGGVNAAFLQQSQGRPGMNQGFLSALQAIQGRPQGT